MKLEQGQVWKKGEDYYRIVKWARLAIDYKLMADLATGQGDLHHVTKKEFCRLIKGAELIDPAAGATDANESGPAPDQPSVVEAAADQQE